MVLVGFRIVSSIHLLQVKRGCEVVRLSRRRLLVLLEGLPLLLCLELL